MSTAREVITEARRLADAATEGPWYSNDRGIGYEVGREPIEPEGTDWPETVNCWLRDTFAEHDARFIAASRTLVPRMADALDAVLRVHHPMRVVAALGKVERQECGADLDPWPCPTVRAIEAAIENT